MTPRALAAWRRAGIVAAAWLAVSLLFLPQGVLINANQPQPKPLAAVVASNLAMFLVWAAFTPAVFALARRHAFARGRRGRSLLVHAGFALAFALAHVLVMAALHYPFVAGRAPFWHLLVNFLAGSGATNVLIYSGVVAAGFAQAYLERYRAGERARAEAQLSALRAQLSPHFLFNALNAISELVHRDAALAEHLILRLSDLLRRVLATGEAHEVALADEMAFSRAYLDLQQALMGERLRIELDVPDALAGARVPSLLLQPLIENAVRHGLANRRAGGTLRVRARRDGDSLELDVADDGAGCAGEPREGIGLANTRARLATLYGDAASLVLGRDPPGFRARVRLPYRSGPTAP